MNKEVEVFMPCRERIDDGVSLGDCAPVFVGHEKNIYAARVDRYRSDLSRLQRTGTLGRMVESGFQVI